MRKLCVFACLLLAVSPVLAATQVGSFSMTTAGTAKTWNDARAACRLLSPRGAWDLPLPDELAGAQAASAILPTAKIGVWSVYAAWVRLGNSLDQAILAGSDLFSKSTGPNGERGLDSLIPLAPFVRDNATDRINEPLVKAVSGGIEVRCVSRSVK